MGQHKTNRKAIAVARGELPPRPPKMSKLEVDRLLTAEVQRRLFEPFIKAAVKMHSEYDRRD